MTLKRSILQCFFAKIFFIPFFTSLINKLLSNLVLEKYLLEIVITVCSLAIILIPNFIIYNSQVTLLFLFDCFVCCSHFEVCTCEDESFLMWYGNQFFYFGPEFKPYSVIHTFKMFERHRHVYIRSLFHSRRWNWNESRHTSCSTSVNRRVSSLCPKSTNVIPSNEQ